MAEDGVTQIGDCNKLLGNERLACFLREEIKATGCTVADTYNPNVDNYTTKGVSYSFLKPQDAEVVRYALWDFCFLNGPKSDKGRGKIKIEIDEDTNADIYASIAGQLKKDKPLEAIYLYRKAIALHDHWSYRVDLGDVLSDLGLFEKAITEYNKSITLCESEGKKGIFAPAHGLGMALFKLKRYDEAEKALRKAISDWDHAGYHYDLGIILQEKGDLEGAAVEFTTVLQMDNGRGVVMHIDYINDTKRRLARITAQLTGSPPPAAGQRPRRAPIKKITAPPPYPNCITPKDYATKPECK